MPAVSLAGPAPTGPRKAGVIKKELARRAASGKVFLRNVRDHKDAKTHMEADLVQRKLIEVLQNIQAASGLECPPITGATKPVDTLPKFDSKIWPVAIGMLAAELGITIADDVNIFRREKGSVALSVDEAVTMVVDLAASQEPSVIQAVNAK